MIWVIADTIPLKAKMKPTFIIIGCASALAAAFAGGYLARDFSSADRTTVEEHDAPLQEFEELNEVGVTCDCQIGHLAPCETKNAEFILLLHAHSNGKRVYSWSQGFCIYDGTNMDADSSMLRYYFSCALGPTGGCSGSVRLLESSDDFIKVLPSWNISWDGNNDRFRSSLLIQPNSRGEVRLPRDNSLLWEMIPVAE